jgi:dTDP-4-amino-4,6-dideoxygalactose transaminase
MNVANDDDVYEYIKKAYSQGMSSIRYLHDTHAYNYRMIEVRNELCSSSYI